MMRKMAKDAEYNKMIQSVQWRKLRHDKLMANPWCERCLAYDGRHTAATQVHHIKPVENAVTYSEKTLLMFSFANLMSVCPDCHDIIHMELGSKNKKQMAEKKRKDELDAFKKKFGFK